MDSNGRRMDADSLGDLLLQRDQKLALGTKLALRPSTGQKASGRLRSPQAFPTHNLAIVKSHTVSAYSWKSAECAGRFGGGARGSTEGAARLDRGALGERSGPQVSPKRVKRDGRSELSWTELQHDCNFSLLISIF